jgi:hypothetical protein
VKSAHKLSIAAGLLLGLALSCGDEEDSDEPVAPPGPASLTITAFIGANGQRFSRDQAAEIELDCSGLLAVELEAPNWLFRPPGNCRSTPQCGHVAVSVDDRVVEASTRTVLVELGDAAAGNHLVHAELRLGDHSAFIGDAGTPVTDELQIEVSVEPCPVAGGAGGTVGQGGSPAAAGAGGDRAGNGGASAGEAGASAGGNSGIGGQGGAVGSGGASAGGGGV